MMLRCAGRIKQSGSSVWPYIRSVHDQQTHMPNETQDIQQQTKSPSTPSTTEVAHEPEVKKDVHKSNEVK